MNFQLLSAETMTAISGNWLSRERASIWAITDLVSIRTKIEKAHNDVLSFVVKPGANALQIRLLMDKTDAAKARHDSKSSGLYKEERIITSPQTAKIKINTGQEVLNLE